MTLEVAARNLLEIYLQALHSDRPDVIESQQYANQITCTLDVQSYVMYESNRT